MLVHCFCIQKGQFDIGYACLPQIWVNNLLEASVQKWVKDFQFKKRKIFWWWRHSWLQQSTWLMEKKSESLSHSCQACKNLFECASQFCCIWESSQQSFSNHLCQESNWSLDSKMAGKLLHVSENWNCYANKMNMHKIVDGVDSEDEIDEWTKWWKMRHVTWEIYKSGTI